MSISLIIKYIGETNKVIYAIHAFLL